MKSKFIFMVLAVLTFGFLLMSGSASAYVTLVNPVGPLVLDNIQQESATGGISVSNILIIESNQEVQITFNSTGNLKREELNSSGAGLGRYDELETIIMNLTIHGTNSWVWSGSMNNFVGVITLTITPDSNGKIWMDISIQAGRTGPDFTTDNSWWENADAGFYLSLITMTVIALGPAFKPSLDLRPDDAEGSSPSSCIQIHNTGDEEKDDAKNVEVAITVVTGSTYVSSVSYNPVVGDIEDGQSKPFCFTIVTNSAWDSASPGTEIKILIEVTREDNRPGHNVGRRAHYTLIK